MRTLPHSLLTASDTQYAYAVRNAQPSPQVPSSSCNTHTQYAYAMRNTDHRVLPAAAHAIHNTQYAYAIRKSPHKRVCIYADKPFNTQPLNTERKPYVPHLRVVSAFPISRAVAARACECHHHGPSSPVRVTFTGYRPCMRIIIPPPEQLPVPVKAMVPNHVSMYPRAACGIVYIEFSWLVKIRFSRAPPPSFQQHGQASRSEDDAALPLRRRCVI